MSLKIKKPYKTRELQLIKSAYLAYGGFKYPRGDYPNKLLHV